MDYISYLIHPVANYEDLLKVNEELLEQNEEV
jgi:hypothetical protein